MRDHAGEHTQHTQKPPRGRSGPLIHKISSYMQAIKLNVHFYMMSQFCRYTSVHACNKIKTNSAKNNYTNQREQTCLGNWKNKWN